jgi:hypothetical protein
LPQGDPERGERVIRMVAQMDVEKFGSCSNEGECEAVLSQRDSDDEYLLMKPRYNARFWRTKSKIQQKAASRNETAFHWESGLLTELSPRQNIMKTSTASL